MKIRIEQLGPAEAPRLRRVRLASLADAPDAFATTLEEAQSFTVEMWREQLSKLVTFVATDERGDAGVVRGATDTEDASTAWLLSMWVAPRARGRGVGDRLVERLLGWAGERGFIRVVLEVADSDSDGDGLRPLTDKLQHECTRLKKTQASRQEA